MTASHRVPTASRTQSQRLRPASPTIGGDADALVTGANEPSTTASSGDAVMQSNSDSLGPPESAGERRPASPAVPASGALGVSARGPGHQPANPAGVTPRGQWALAGGHGD